MDKKTNNINKKIGIKLKLERTKRGLSQEKLAEMAEISPVSVGYIERAKISPTIETLAKIADALGLTLNELTDVSKVDL